MANRLGIDYDDVRAVRADILYCSISGFGQTGPYRDRPGFDIMAQGIVGFLRMTGQPDGRPAKIGIAINDIAAGATAIYSIMAAQMTRQQTGKGQYMDISLVDAGLAWTVWESGAFFGAGEVPQPTGTRHRRSTPYQAYRTRDGYVTIGAANDRLWERLVDRRAGASGVGSRTSASPPCPTGWTTSTSSSARSRQITTTRTTDEWIEVIDKAGVPGGPVLTYDETLNDPHVLARDMVVEVEHPIIGPMRTIGPPTKFSDLDFAVRGPAPWLGQHTAEVLRDAGVNDDEIEQLFTDGVLFDAHPELEEGLT